MTIQSTVHTRKKNSSMWLILNTQRYARASAVRVRKKYSTAFLRIPLSRSFTIRIDRSLTGHKRRSLFSIFSLSLLYITEASRHLSAVEDEVEQVESAYNEIRIKLTTMLEEKQAARNQLEEARIRKQICKKRLSDEVQFFLRISLSLSYLFWPEWISRSRNRGQSREAAESGR